MLISWLQWASERRERSSRTYNGLICDSKRFLIWYTVQWYRRSGSSGHLYYIHTCILSSLWCTFIKASTTTRTRNNNDWLYIHVFPTAWARTVMQAIIIKYILHHYSDGFGPLTNFMFLPKVSYHKTQQERTHFVHVVELLTLAHV